MTFTTNKIEKLKMGRRPLLLTALSISHAVLAIIFLGGIAQLSIVASQERDDPDTVRGLLIGMAFCGIFAFTSVVAALGFWLRTKWARTVALTSLSLCVLGLSMGFYSNGDWEWTVLPWLLVFTVLLALHWLPAVKQGLSHSPEISSAQIRG